MNVSGNDRNMGGQPDGDPKSSHTLSFHRNRSRTNMRPGTSPGTDTSGAFGGNDRSNNQRDVFGGTNMGSSANLPRAISPSPSVRSTVSNSGPKPQNMSQSVEKGKSSFWPFRKGGRSSKKDDEPDGTSTPPRIKTRDKLGGGRTNDQFVGNGRLRLDSMPKRGSSSGHGNAEFQVNPSLYEFTPAGQGSTRKNITGSAPLSKFKPRRGETFNDRKESTVRKEPDNNFFLLDTDLMNMEGIVQPLTPPEVQEQFQPLQQQQLLPLDELKGGKGDPVSGWAAPESWGANKPTVDDQVVVPIEEEVVEIPGRKASVVQASIRLLCMLFTKANNSSHIAFVFSVRMVLSQLYLLALHQQ